MKLPKREPTKSGYDLIRQDIARARRGWLEPADMLTTYPLADFRAALRSKP